MKILVASKLPPWKVGGLETYLQTLASAAREHGGHDMEFLFCPADEMKVTGEKGAFSAMHFAPISPVASRLAFTMASRPVLHPLLEAWIAFQTRPALAKLGKRKDFDAIHFVGTGWDLSGFALKRLANRMRIPFTVWPAVHPYSWGDDVIDLCLYRQADTVFCQTAAEADHLVQKGVERGRISMCGLPPSVATNGDGTALRERLEIGTRPTVLFMGRRDEGKGYPALLRAWSMVLASVPDAVLLLAGRGGEEYQHLIHQLPIESVCDLGVVDDSTKADALAACDVFCLPSSHESFGIVYVEAWSYRKPVVCGTAPACRELVEDLVTGLHSTQDSRKLAAAILRLLENPDEAKRMGEAGLKMQQEKFTTRRLVECHVNAWKAIRGGDRRPS